MNDRSSTHTRMIDMTNTTAWVLAASLGFLLAGGPTMAQETTTDPVATEEVAAAQRDIAREANEAAAEEAAKALQAATRLDLDIRMIGPTSVKIASGQQTAR